MIVTEKDLPGKKRFCRWKDGCEIYSMSLRQFQKLANEAGAVYKVNKMVLINMEVFEEYLEFFHIKPEEM